uniref:Uncharacterized protein n=1 Tax=Junco hyemalis TaxID=40217 RepID=A0A8C5NN90_JUNHY
FANRQKEISSLYLLIAESAVKQLQSMFSGQLWDHPELLMRLKSCDQTKLWASLSSALTTC